MYLLYAEDCGALAARTVLFATWFEPMLSKLDRFAQAGGVPADFTEIPQYLQVCRWPFRKLEYSFALDALCQHLKPGDRYLDAGCGVTPLSHVIAANGVRTDACDLDEQVVRKLDLLDADAIYGSHVTLSCQCLTRTSYGDNTFDAISCISVLEHIPAPDDQAALHEMLRILKTGGVLVLTVDYTPPHTGMRGGHLWHYAARCLELARSGNVREIARGIGRKLRARQVTRAGAARLARSANQCFEADHLERDILPALDGEELPSRLPFPRDVRSVTPDDARRFWELESRYDPRNFRAVLPVGIIVRKPAPVLHAAV